MSLLDATGDGLTINLDLDGVCADWLRDFGRHLVDIGCPPKQLQPFPPTEYDFPRRQWGLGDWSDLFDTYKAARRYRNLEWLPGAQDGVATLKRAGYRIRVVTHRIWNDTGRDEVAEDTVAWLASRDFPYDELCLVGRKGDLSADVVIDDHPGLAWAQPGAVNLLFNQPWNHDDALAEYAADVLTGEQSWPDWRYPCVSADGSATFEVHRVDGWDDALDALGLSPEAAK